MGRLGIGVFPDTSQTLITSRFTITQQWRDKRLFGAACEPALSDTLSLARWDGHLADGRADLASVGRDTIHLAHAAVLGQLVSWPEAVDSSEFILNQTLPWLGRPPAGASALCEDCVQYQEVLDVRVTKQFNFRLFPFDTQHIDFELAVDGADIFDCATLTDGLHIDLPTDNTWWFNGEQVAFSSVRGSDGCTIQIPIRRNFVTFFVKNIIILLIIIQSVLLALNLNPKNPPLLGGRFSGMIFGLNLISSRSNDSTKQLPAILGNVTGLLWLDYFYLFQFTVVFAALMETAAVAILSRTSHDDYAYRMDHVFRWLLPLVAYPVGTLGMLIWPVFDLPALGLSLCGVGFLGGLAFGVALIYRQQVAYEREKTVLAERLAERLAEAQGRAAALSSADEDDEQGNKEEQALEPSLLQKVFDFYDLDQSETISRNEIKPLLKHMYPHMGRRHEAVLLRQLALDEVQEFVRCELETLALPAAALMILTPLVRSSLLAGLLSF